MPRATNKPGRSLDTGERKRRGAKIAGPRQALPLPHERDENAREQEHHDIDSRIEQAEDDLREGRRDTDARAAATDRFNRRWPSGKPP